MRLRVVLLVVAGLLGAGGGWLFTKLVLDEPASQPAASGAIELVGQRRPDFSLGGSGGEPIHAADFDGQVWLINFWATWCKPCREEMPMLSELHQQLSGRGFSVLGIALDDVAPAREFLAELDIRYPNAIGTVDVMAVSALYGNHTGVLPYSVLVDRDGVIRWSVLGEVDEEEISALIEELL
jgi:peroxiredoxin